MQSFVMLKKVLQDIIKGIISIGLVLSLVNCATTKPGAGYEDDTPSDIQRLMDKEYKHSICAVGTATGADEATAKRKAVLHARAEIAREFKTQIDVLQKSYEESINSQTVEEYQQATEVFATLEVSGSTIAKSMVRNEKNGSVTAKALVVVTAEQLQALVNEKMQAYTSFKASQAYKELEKRVALERQSQE